MSCLNFIIGFTVTAIVSWLWTIYWTVREQDRKDKAEEERLDRWDQQRRAEHRT